ncbi:MAG: hypothetical protein INR65_00890 [Gluconacetobacter diazotrophicus]|nr:hypothetical protein [Gluconacetobacter diazotrophicus]
MSRTAGPGEAITGEAGRTFPALSHLEALLDGTGVLQHATFGVAAREHGYCLDDNARALILAARLRERWPELPVAGRLWARTAAFVQHAWDPGRGVFRNFMSFDRRWLEARGSDDSHGRAVWALGSVAGSAAADEDARNWASWLLGEAAPRLPVLRSPRAIALGLLGLAAAGNGGGAERWTELAERLGGRLGEHLGDERRPGWCWFESALSYDNARLPQALLAAGRRFGRPDWREAGLETLDWLCGVQRTERGGFRPVGSNGFFPRGGERALFDQQPIEAAAAVSACLEAWRWCGEERWLERARQAHAWFTGDNDLGVALAVVATGGCRDGLHPDRVNANQGAESTLAWLLADGEMADAEREVTARTGRGA